MATLPMTLNVLQQCRNVKIVEVSMEYVSWDPILDVRATKQRIVQRETSNQNAMTIIVKAARKTNVPRMMRDAHVLLLPRRNVLPKIIIYSVKSVVDIRIILAMV